MVEIGGGCDDMSTHALGYVQMRRAALKCTGSFLFFILLAPGMSRNVDDAYCTITRVIGSNAQSGMEVSLPTGRVKKCVWKNHMSSPKTLVIPDGTPHMSSLING